MDALLSLLPGGGTVTVLVGAVAAILFALWRAFAAGKTSARAKQLEADAKAMTEARKIEEAIAGNDPDANRNELKKWSR